MTGSAMTTRASEVQNLVQQITQEALRQLDLQGSLTKGLLAVLPEYLFDPSGVAKYLRERQQPVTCAILGQASPPLELGQALPLQTLESRQQLASDLHSYSELVVVTPTLSLIHQLASGDDRDFSVLLILRPLLWGKPVTLLLDFELPVSRRSALWDQFSQDLSSLESLGLRLASMARQAAAGEPARKDLVTEQDVRAAQAQSQTSIRIKPSAIVTQLASELAKELGISIEV